MTRKDYELIASVLRDAATRSVLPETGELSREQKVLFNNLVTSFSYKLRQDNARFNAAKFAEAAYRYEADIKWVPSDADLKEVA